MFIGRFNATPATATIPLSGNGPEQWQFYARAVKRDVEIGKESPAMTVVVS